MWLISLLLQGLIELPVYCVMSARQQSVTMWEDNTETTNTVKANMKQLHKRHQAVHQEAENLKKQVQAFV